MEPERKIEKRLRAYAKKRRAEAGDSLKLHPATRRLLQGEAARRAPRPGGGDVRLPFLARFGRRWMFAACMVAVAGIGVSLFLPASSPEKKRAQSIGAVKELRQIGMATRRYAEDNGDMLPASLGELTNELDTRKALIDPVSGKPFVYAGAGKKLDGLQSNAVLAYSPESENGQAVLFADGRVEVVAHGAFIPPANQKSTGLVLADKVVSEKLAKASVNAPAATPPSAADLEMQKPGSTVSQAFVQTRAAANLQNRYRNVSASARTAPVLQSFQVLQNGDAVSVVDRDGSVYQGSVQPVNATVVNAPASVETTGGTVASSQSQAGEFQSAGNQPPAAQNYFFRVAGMNRTLKQSVVFAGNLQANPGVRQTAPSGNSFGGIGGGGAGNQPPPAATNAAQQSLLSNARIVGTAVIDDTNQIEIDAVPAAP